MFISSMLSDNQVRILRENKRICEQYRFHHKRANGNLDRDTMFAAISYDLQLPVTTIGSRIQQMTKQGVKFPMLQRKRRNSIVMPTADLNAIFAEDLQSGLADDSDLVNAGTSESEYEIEA